MPPAAQANGAQDSAAALAATSADKVPPANVKKPAVQVQVEPRVMVVPLMHPGHRQHKDARLKVCAPGLLHLAMLTATADMAVTWLQGCQPTLRALAACHRKF